jgi:hypothetical protein
MKVKKTIKLQVLVTEQEKVAIEEYLDSLTFPLSIPAFIRQTIAEKIEKNSKAT